MGYNNHNHNNNYNNQNNNTNNHQYNNNTNQYNNYDTILINEEFKNIPLNNFDEIFQIKNENNDQKNKNIKNKNIKNNNNNNNNNDQKPPNDKYSIIIFRDLITNKFNDSLPLLLSTIIENPIQYSNLIDTINHLKLKSSSKLSDSIHNTLYLLSFLIIFIITLLLLLLLPFNIYYYFWTIITIPIIFSIYYIDKYLKIKCIRNFIIKTENTHFSLSNMNEWRNQKIVFKSIFFRRTKKGYLKKVNSKSSNNDIKDYSNFYQGLIIEFPMNLLTQQTIFNLQIMDYKNILNNTNNQHYENYDELRKHIKQQQLQSTQNHQHQQHQSTETVIDIDYNEHFIQNYYNFNNNNTNINNKINSNMNSNYFSYHINDQ